MLHMILSHRMLFMSFLAAAVFGALYLVGDPLCHFCAYPPGDIRLSPPQVYSRERLINQTFLEERWLQEQLLSAEKTEKLVDTSIQRAIERAITGRAKLSLSPDSTNDPNVPDAANPGARANTPTTSTGILSRMSFWDEFKIRAALRDSIHQRILENQLDDRHDLKGNTIFALKFDASIFPASPHKKAFIEATISHSFDQSAADSKKKELFERWAADSAARVNARIKQIADTLSSQWTQRYRREVIDRLQDNFDDPRHGDRAQQDKTKIVPAADTTFEDFLSLIRKNDDSSRFLLRAVNEIIVIEALEPFFGPSVRHRRFSYTKEDRRSDADLEQFGLDADTSATFSTLITGAVRSRQRMGEVAVRFDEKIVGLYSTTEDCLAKNLALLGQVNNQLYFAVPTYPDYLDKLIREGLDSVVERFNDTSPKMVSKEIIDTLGISRADCQISSVYVNTGFEEFTKHFSQVKLATYAVLPRQSFKVLDEVVSARDRIAGALAASANGANVGASTIRDLSQAWGAVSASPLVTGYAFEDDREAGSAVRARFGWIVDPSARQLLGGTAGGTDTFAPIQESLMAIVSMPAWLDEIKVEIRTGWLDARQRRLLQREIGGAVDLRDGVLGQSNVNLYTVPVPLPPLFETLDDLIFTSNKRRPIIDVYNFRPAALRACEPGQLVIPGLRLWRNTVVTLDGQRAEQIIVMPNMEGIQVKFSKVLPPSNDFSAQLRIWTSEGVADWPDKIEIRAAAAPCSADSK